MRSRNPDAASAVVAAVIAMVLAAPLAAAAQTEPPLQQRFEIATADLELARGHLAGEDFERAEALLADLVKHTPELSEAHFLLAKARYGAGRFPAALSSIEKAQTTLAVAGPVMARVRDARKAKLAAERNKQLALIEAIEVPARSSGVALPDEAVKRIADARDAIYLLDRQIAALDEAETMTRAEYAFIHGNVLLRNGRRHEAAGKYVDALAIVPSYSAAANNLASLFYDAQLHDRALAVIEQVEANGGSVNPALRSAVLKELGR
jgi:Tfp pilus assembly protein PilF